MHSVFLGFDFGTKSIGIAVGQSITRSANPLTTLAAQQGKPDWEVLNKLIDTWRPDGLVVGLPLNMDGSEQPITRAAQNFVSTLKKNYPLLPVYQIDERLTTVAARAEVFNSGGYRALQASNNKKRMDSIAAKLILEAWLLENY